MVTEHVVVGAFERVERVEEALVAFLRDAEVAELSDEGCYAFVHRTHENRYSFGRVVHHVLVDVGAEAEAEGLEPRGDRPRRAQREHDSARRGLLQEITAGYAFVRHGRTVL